MDNISIRGQVISGEFGKVMVRQKSGEPLEIGELLVAETAAGASILQVYDLCYGSQLSQQHLELVSGMTLEDDIKAEFMDPELRNYTLGFLKNLVSVSKGQARLSKTLPNFFSSVRTITEQDLSFLAPPEEACAVGKLRSGSRKLDVDVALPGSKTLSHHILISGTTGRGKSNLLSSLLWNLVDKDFCGMLVLDPHDEYYGRGQQGLKDHPAGKVSYYTTKGPPAGTNTLKINLTLVKPQHLDGVIDFSDAQRQAIALYHKENREKWIEAIILERPLQLEKAFREETLAVVKRRLLQLLDLDFVNNKLFCNGIFQLNAGLTTIADITKDLEDSKTVIIDTSSVSGSVELLLGSLVAHEAFHRYKQAKMAGSMRDKPVINIVLEEAPRVLGKDVLERGSNIFSTIAREGRKFKVGLTAITQLPSLIPREILANMNTKIILGIEMKPERQAIIESAAHDLSEHDRAIASLDVGEAIVTSTFSKFPMPVAIPFFRDVIEETTKRDKGSSARTAFSELGN